MLYPQNGDRIVAIDTVTSLHPMCTHKCLHNMAPPYLSTVCQPVPSVPGRRLGELDFLVSIWPHTVAGRLPIRLSYVLNLSACESKGQLSHCIYF